MIPTRWFDHPAYMEPHYEPVWAACAEHDLVLHTHSGAGPADYGLGPGIVSIYAAEAWWWAARPFWVLLLSGVFERHPTLKYVIAENGAVGARPRRPMDEKWVGGHNTHKFGNAFKNGSRPQAERVRRRALLLRRLDAGSTTSTVVTPSASATCCGATTSRTPRARTPHPLLDQRAVPRRPRRRGPAHPRAERRRPVPTRRARALAPIVDRIGPTAAEVHGPQPCPMPTGAGGAP